MSKEDLRILSIQILYETTDVVFRKMQQNPLAGYTVIAAT